MFKNLLIPLDGSPLAEKAIAPAVALARCFDSEITLVQVLSTKTIWTDMAMDSAALMADVAAANLEHAETYMKDKAHALRSQGLRVSQRIVHANNVPNALLNIVDGHDIDLVVMSTHGYTGLRRFVMGSVAEQMVRYAQAPVLLIRSDLDAELLEPTAVPVKRVAEA